MFNQSKKRIGLALIVIVLAVTGSAQDGNKDGNKQDNSKSKEAPKAESSMPLEQMVKTIVEQPILADQSFYYDDGFKAVGSYSIHDHFGKKLPPKNSENPSDFGVLWLDTALVVL
jgi:hypothetical protein